VAESGSRTFVIIGNGVAGTSAAETLRKGDPEARIVLIGDEPHPLYNRVALPKVLKGVTAPERTIIKSVQWHVDNRVELHLTTLVTGVDTEKQVVTTEDGASFRYDSLLVATGGTPNRVTVPGSDGTRGIYPFQTLEDTKTILDRVRKSKSAVTTGGSFIAYELTEGFRHHGVATTWIMRGTRFLHRILDEEGGQYVDHLARAVGVETVYEDSIGSVNADADGDLQSVVTTKGRELDCDLLGAGLGLKMRLECLAGTPVKINRGIVTNEYLETSVPGVYAAGDVAEFFDISINAYNQMGTWNSAGSHGKVAAANMLGTRTEFREVPYYTSTMFDSQMAAIGIMPESVPDMEAVTRLNLERGIYRRLFFIDGRLAGAALIGDIRVRRELMDTIRSQRQVSNAERENLLSV
jgi:NAD(P)H-nitrite reductase large subunit